MITILMILTKMATLSLLKIKLFYNKSYDVIISFNNVVSNKILSCKSDYVVDVAM